MHLEIKLLTIDCVLRLGMEMELKSVHLLWSSVFSSWNLSFKEIILALIFEIDLNCEAFDSDFCVMQVSILEIELSFMISEVESFSGIHRSDSLGSQVNWTLHRQMALTSFIILPVSSILEITPFSITSTSNGGDSSKQ